MIINKTTGEIAYHSIILTEKDGEYIGWKFKQYPLKDEKGEVEFIEPLNKLKV